MILAVLFAYFVTLVSSWGGDGHRIITTLALNIMKSRNGPSLLEPLGDLMKASTWADSDEVETLYPQSGAYHFSSTPYRKCAAFDLKRDCGFGKTKGLCIVTGLADAISKAVDPYTSQSSRTDSLKFILHLMADIHQPLHTGFREDTGGLRIILGQPDGVDLHAIWDTRMIEELRASMESSDLVAHLTDKLSARNGSLPHRIQSATNLTQVLSSESRIMEYVAGLASETSTTTTCKLAYMGLDSQWIGVGDSLTTQYYSSRVPTVMVQILKAGVRLGLVLDAIADTLYLRRSVMKEVRKAKRIWNLFDRPPVSETSQDDDALDTNRFAPLFIQFDPVEDMSFTTVSGPLATASRDVGKAGRTSLDDDNTLLGESSKSVTNERQSYTFFGVDLSEVSIAKANGFWLVSTKSRLANPRYWPASYQVVIRLTNKDGNIHTQHFGLDKWVFPSELNHELLIRTVLRVTGIDPRIDITDYLPLIRPTRAGILSNEQSDIVGALYFEHTTTPRAHKTAASIMHHISGLKGKIHVFRLPEHKLIAFVHSDTLLKRKKGKILRNRFNRSPLLVKWSKERKPEIQSVFVDPAIVYEFIYPVDASSTSYYPLLYKVAREHVIFPMEADQLLKEMVEVEEAKRRQTNGESISNHLGGKYVEWFFDYNGDEKFTYFVFEWFPKGVTKDAISRMLPLSKSVYTHVETKPGLRYIYSVDKDIVPVGKKDMFPGGISEATVKGLCDGVSEFYAGSLQCSEHLTDPVLCLLSNNEHLEVQGFDTGRNLRALFTNNTEQDPYRYVHRIIQRTVNGTEISEPIVYLVDIRILRFFNISMDRIHLIISQLERIVAGKWNVAKTLRPSLYSELEALDDYLSPRHTSEPTSADSLPDMIQYIVEYTPPGAPYGMLQWMGKA